MGSKLRVAAAQVSVTWKLEENLRRAASLVEDARREGVQFVAFPECFVGKYGVAHFAKWAEDTTGPGSSLLASASLRGMTSTGGVIERQGDDLFNSMPVYSRGSLVATYRKVHLSRVLGVTSESDVLKAGESGVVVDVEGFRVAMACCFDLRFRAFLDGYGPAVENPADILCAPSAFLDVTGKDHWDVLLRRAALDGQCYVVAPNVAYAEDDDVPLHGRSAVVDPWSRILAQTTAQGNDLAIADVDTSVIADTRSKLPLKELSRRNYVH